MELQEVGGGCGDWMDLAQDRDRWRALVSTVKKVNFLTSCKLVSFSRRTLLHGVSKQVYVLDTIVEKLAICHMEMFKTYMSHTQRAGRSKTVDNQSKE
jgi:hypothetical protein